MNFLALAKLFLLIIYLKISLKLNISYLEILSKSSIFNLKIF